MRVSRIPNLGFVVLVAMIGTGVAVAADPPFERAKVEGFAVVRIVHNGRIAPGTVEIERTEDGRNARLPATLFEGRKNPVTYANWLAPGTYRFLRLWHSTPLGVWADYGDLNIEPLQLPTFTVKAGELVDLGTWLQQPMDDRIAIVPLNDPRAFGEGRHNERLEEAAPAFPGPPTRWDGAEHWSQAGLGREVVAGAMRSLMVVKPPQFDNDGNAYFGSVLGQILRRTPQGQWRNLDTGTLDTLSSLLVDGANIYASTEQHRLLHSLDGGATWVTAQVPVEANVTAIARLPNGDFIAATEAMYETKPHLLRGPDLLNLPPTPWTTLESGRTPRLETRRVALAGPVAERLVAWVEPRSLHVYDIANDRWTSSQAVAPLGEPYVNPSAGLVYSPAPTTLEGVAAGIRLNDGLMSADGGTSWQSMSLSSHNGVGFRDRSNGIAMRTDRHGVETFIETTRDGGTTWDRVETAVPGFCSTAEYLPPTDELVCFTQDGWIQVTRTGQDWTTERRGL